MHNSFSYIMGETQKEIVEIVREIPDVTARDIMALMPHKTPNAISSTLHLLKTRGIVVVTGKKREMNKDGSSRSNTTYAVNPSPKPFTPRLKVVTPSTTALEERNKELLAKVEELEDWKRNALARYPDLAVSPTVLKARKLVAEEVRAGGDYGLADHIMAGQKDNTLMVRVAIRALEESE